MRGQIQKDLEYRISVSDYEICIKKLEGEKEQQQLFLLTMSYYNLGYFDNVKKTAALLKEKYPAGSYTESVSSITSYLPQ